MTERNYGALDYAVMGARTLMKKFTPALLPPAGLFHYHQGVFLSGTEKTYLHTGLSDLADYIKAWVDGIVSPDGVITNYVKERFDDLQPGILLFRLYRETGDSRYKKAIETIYSHMRVWPKNKAGGFFHKFEHPNQMWLDGLYMAGPFLTMYGAETGNAECFDEFYRQAAIMWQHNRRSGSDLMYHAWDESREEAWADKETGISPECWGRAFGWYIVALTTALDYIPNDYPHRGELIEIIRRCAAVIAKYQDSKSGLWYQVVDKGYDENNWTETSCSALFTAGLAKAAAEGYIGGEYESVIEKGYCGVINAVTVNDDETISVPRICVGTGVGDYDFYIQRPTVENDLHGMGAFLLMCNEYEDFKPSKQVWRR